MKKFIRISITVLTAAIVLLYIITCFTSYTSTYSFSYSKLLSIIYLPTLLVYGLLLMIWFFKSKKVFATLLILSLAGYKNFNATFAFNFSSSWKWEKDSTAIRAMSWNVNRFGNAFLKNDSVNSDRRQMLAFISKVQPDILCVQDFRVNEEVGKRRRSFVDNFNDVIQAGNFAYINYPFFFEYNGPNYCDKFGVAIFSKLPVVDTGSFINQGAVSEERSAYIDVLLHSKPLRVFTTHLSSLSLWSKDEAGLKHLRGDSTKIKAMTILSKIRHYGEIHEREAAVLKSAMNKSPYPILFTGDLNSVPSSHVYHHLRSGLNDAFLQHDHGIGGTYNRVFPKLRIDVLFHSNEIEVTQFTRPAINLSDHYPIIADIRWKK